MGVASCFAFPFFFFFLLNPLTSYYGIHFLICLIFLLPFKLKALDQAQTPARFSSVRYIKELYAARLKSQHPDRKHGIKGLGRNAFYWRRFSAE